MKAILLIVLLFFVAGCSNNNQSKSEISIKDEVIKTQMPSESPKQSESLNKIGFIDIEKDLKLNDLYLNMTLSELIEIMGKEIEKTDEIEYGDEGKSYELIFGDGTIVTMLNNEVFAVEVTSNKYRTSRGLSVGDTKEKVLELYQYPSYGYEEMNEWQYTTSNDYTLFTIQFIENKVSKIGINLIL